MIREISRRKCLRLWLCKPEYMERTKWENRFVLLRFWKKNYMMFLKDLKRFKMERLYDKLKAYSEKMKTEVESKAEKLDKIGYKEYMAQK